MPAEIRTDEELAVLLGTLGSTGDEVASMLSDCEIRGVRSEPDACPIANWLKAEAADVSNVHVDGDLVVLNETGCAPPDAVADFIKRFDIGVFPALIQEG